MHIFQVPAGDGSQDTKPLLLKKLLADDLATHHVAMPRS